MASYLSAFKKKSKGCGGLEFRELDPKEHGNSSFRLAIRQVATIQQRFTDPETGEIRWRDLETFANLNLAAMVAFDSSLHDAPMPWRLQQDLVIMPDVVERPSAMRF